MNDHDGVLPFPGRPGGAEPELVSAAEALLFASGEPLSTQRLSFLLSVPSDDVRLVLSVLQDRFGPGRGIRLERVAKGWQLRTARDYASLVLAMLGAKPRKLTRPQLEVLACVAYRQPVTRGEVDTVRGVDSGPLLRKLLDRGLISVAGRSQNPGRALLYKTTREFLKLFDLPDLSSLPTIEERLESQGPTEE